MTHKKYQPQKTLGPVSAEFIRALKAKGQVVFLLEDAKKLTGTDRAAAVSFINSLVQRNIVARLNAGVYLLLETAQESAQLSNWPLIASALVGKNPYYISHYAAMRLHGMTTHALIEITITLTKRYRNKEINHIHYKFIYAQPKHFWGFELKWASKHHKVSVSDLERTILDALNRPEYCGGLSEIIRGIWLKQNEIHWERLVTYAKKFPTKAAIKRLGYILEALEIGTEQLPKLQQMIHAAKDYVLLDPQGENRGQYIQRWRLRVNVFELKEGF